MLDPVQQTVGYSVPSVRVTLVHHLHRVARGIGRGRDGQRDQEDVRQCLHASWKFVFQLWPQNLARGSATSIDFGSQISA